MKVLTIKEDAWTLGRVENRKCWKIIKPQVDPTDVHKHKTICMI